MLIPDRFFPLVILIGFFLNTLFFLTLFFTPKYLRISPQKIKSLPKIIYLIYLIYAFILPGEIQDVGLFSSVGYILRQNLDFYQIDVSHGTYPFFPFMAFFYIIANWINEVLPILRFSFIVKITLIPVLYFLSREIPDYRQRLFFLLSPVVFAPVIIHGQADILVVLFLILAIKQIRQKPILSGLFYSLSILTKSWSVFLFPLFLWHFRFRKILPFIIAFILPIFLDVFIYTRLFHSSFKVVLNAALGHPGSGTGESGLSQFIFLLPKSLNQFIFQNHRIFTSLFFFLFYLIIFLKKVNPLKGAKVILLVFNVFSLAWGVQYIIWLLPIAFIDKDYLNAKIYSILSIPYLVLMYFAITHEKFLLTNILKPTDPIVLFSLLLPWSFSVFWLWREMSRSSLIQKLRMI